MLASAGFGVTFAYTQGVHHGPALAGCAVAMALGLELAKPFAVEGVFSCLRNWAFGRALAMALLGFVAVAYSLTAELSLMATTRGDAAAERARAGDTAKDDRAELARLASERAAMTFTAATAEAVTAAREAVAAAERTRKAECGDGSAKQRGRNCRAREADEATARAGLATATADKAATDRAAKLDADAATVRARLAKASPVAAAADPGAAALANYLRLFGLSIPAALLSEWLVLVGVIALELGSALAVVLVRAAAPSPSLRTVGSEAVSNADSPKRTPLDTPARARPRTAKGRRLGPSGKQRRRLGQSDSEVSKASAAPVARDRAQARIVDTLKASPGGKLDGDGASVRGLAALIGGKRSTVHAALVGLVAGGIVAKVGTALVLTVAA